MFHEKSSILIDEDEEDTCALKGAINIPHTCTMRSVGGTFVFDGTNQQLNTN